MQALKSRAASWVVPVPRLPEPSWSDKGLRPVRPGLSLPDKQALRAGAHLAQPELARAVSRAESERLAGRVRLRSMGFDIRVVGHPRFPVLRR